MLACRVYRIEPTLERQIRSLLLESSIGTPLPYGSYQIPNENLELCILIKNRVENSYGTQISIWADDTIKLFDREKKEQIIRFVKPYDIQLFDTTLSFLVPK